MVEHLLPPDYEAALTKLIGRLPILVITKDFPKAPDVSDLITIIDPSETKVDEIAAFNTRNTGRYAMM